MKKIIILFFIAVLSLELNSQTLPEFISNDSQFEFKTTNHEFYNKEVKAKAEVLFGSQIIRRPYDVLEYDIYLNWYDVLTKGTFDGANRTYSGTNIIKLRADSANLAALYFDCLNQKINSVKVNNQSVLTFSKTPTNGQISVYLPKMAKEGDTIIVEINFEYVGTQNYGAYMYPKGMYVGMGPVYKKDGENHRDSVFVEENLVYTMAEPEMARSWMPCNDRPYDKALVKISVRLPLDYTCASNGTLVEFSKFDGVSTISKWVSRDPMATYLIHVAASKFAKYTEIYKGAKNIPVEYYMWLKDSANSKTDNSVYNATNAFRNTLTMLKAFETKWSPYPFEKYGMVAVQPFDFGGMEHQTMTTVNRIWLRGTSESGIAHELGHQWLGDLITCATWKDLWINEGGATWSEAIYAEFFNPNYYYSTMLSKRQGYLWGGGVVLPKIYNMDMGDLFNVYITYYKSSWIYHMLRMHLGDTAFFNSFKSLLNKYAFKSLETEQFKQSFKDDNPDSGPYLDDFFEQWLNNQGHPIFTSFTRIKPDNDKWIARVTLNQVQEFKGTPEIFKTKLRILALDTLKKVEEKFEVYMDKRSQEFTINTSFYPHKIVVDSNFTLSEFLLSEITGVDDQNDKSEFRIIPNPQLAGEKILINIPESINEDFQVSIVDILGNQVFINKYYNEKAIYLDTKNLVRGSYSMIIRNNEKILKSSFILY